MRFPLQTNQILQHGFALRCTINAFLDRGARIFLEKNVASTQISYLLPWFNSGASDDQTKNSNTRAVKREEREKKNLPVVRPVRCSAHDQLGDTMVINKLDKPPCSVVAGDDRLARIHLFRVSESSNRADERSYHKTDAEIKTRSYRHRHEINKPTEN